MPSLMLILKPVVFPDFDYSIGMNSIMNIYATLYNLHLCWFNIYHFPINVFISVLDIDTNVKFLIPVWVIVPTEKL